MAVGPLASHFNPIALIMAKTLWSFCHSECSRVKVLQQIFLYDGHGTVRQAFLFANRFCYLIQKYWKNCCRQHGVSFWIAALHGWFKVVEGLAVLIDDRSCFLFFVLNTLEIMFLYTVLQVRRGIRNNLGIIHHISALTPLHSERPKLHVLSAIGLK